MADNENNLSNENKLSYEDLRETYYKCRNFELSHLWQRSVFLTAFLVLCFTGYGNVLLRLINNLNLCITNLLINEIAIIIAILGLAFSAIWVMMAKGSKAWYEVYERAICNIEETALPAPENYGMSELATKFKKADSNFFSNNAGKYSVSKLNITIGRIMFYTWCSVFLVHLAYNLFILLKQFGQKKPVCFHMLITFALYLFFVNILFSVFNNKWAPSSALG